MVAFDSNVFIYFMERDEVFFESASRALQPVVERSEPGVISVLVVTEIVNGNPRANLDLLALPNLSVLSVSLSTAKLAGKLRAEHSALRTVDALHLATAFESGCDTFVTNDKQLANLRLPIKIVPLERYTGAA